MAASQLCVAQEEEEALVIKNGQPKRVYILLVVGALLSLGLFVLSNWYWQDSLIGERLGRIEESLTALRASVLTQKDIEVVFLKIIVLRPSVDISLAKKIAPLVMKYSKMRDLDPSLVLSIIDVESQFNPEARSNIEIPAVGLMQLMPHWVKVLGIVGALTDPEVSIKYGTLVFSLYYGMYRDINLALTVYNRGPNPVDWSIIRNEDPTKNRYVVEVMQRYQKLKQVEL